MQYDLAILVGRLDSVCTRAFERAAHRAQRAGHEDLTAGHLLIELLSPEASSLVDALAALGFEPDALRDELEERLNALPRTKARLPIPSVELQSLLTEAWVLASAAATAPEAQRIRPSHILTALLNSDELRQIARVTAPSLLAIPKGATLEVEDETEDVPDADEPGEPSPQGTPTEALDRYTTDLTALARAGLIDSIVGRDREIRQIVDILLRRRQNNPILVGEAGVGKTAAVEGFALRVSHGDIPTPLQNISVRTLDLGALRAGASLQGEFEARLKQVVAECGASPRPVVLFIDEAHTLIGAGGAAGTGDAANLLKPALARGELRTIAATTWSEYKKHVEKDPALARRFQVVKVDEPDTETAIAMLRAITQHLVNHHGTRILDEAVVQAVRLSERYITGRRLPDKAVSVLDTACARVAVGQGATPAAVEDRTRAIQRLETEIGMLTDEQKTGRDHAERIRRLYMELDTEEADRADLMTQWGREWALVNELLAMDELSNGSKESEEPKPAEEGTEEPAAEVAEAVPDIEHRRAMEQSLAELQGDSPLVPACVDAHVVAEVISAWTGIPVTRMHADQIESVLGLRDKLAQRVIGQDAALETICRRIRTASAGMADPNKPQGVFLLVGPTGVGKTETAVTVAETLYGGEQNMLVINMSEYQEPHSIAGLKGSPPGYVGYGEGGVLTEGVRRNPYSLVLLDEVEKAHPDVLELFYQVFDKGCLDDSEGVSVDFRNTLIIMTSNVGEEVLTRASSGTKPRPSADELVDSIRPDLERRFPLAWLGRTAVVPYLALDEQSMTRVVRLKLDAMRRRLLVNHEAKLEFDDPEVDAVTAQCVGRPDGARAVDRILTHTLLPQLSDRILQCLADGLEFSRVRLKATHDGQFEYIFSNQTIEITSTAGDAPVWRSTSLDSINKVAPRGKPAQTPN